MTNRNHAISQGINALSVSAEFLLCAIRALAQGEDPECQAVADPLRWAGLKLREAMEALQRID